MQRCENSRGSEGHAKNHYMKYLYNYICPVCDRRGIDSRQEYNLLISDAENNFKIKCKRGHIKTVVYTDEKYNMLFASAMDCIRAGQLREAVANFAASYERLLEYAIQIIAVKYRIEPSEFDLTWKLLKNQSERQLGGFCIMYLHAFKKTAPVFREDQIKFRNAVIHKGAFPTFNEITAFAISSFEVMAEILCTLNKNCAAAIAKHSKEGRLAIEKKRTPNGILSLIRIGSALDFDYIAHPSGKPTASAMKRQIELWKHQFSNVP